MIYFWYSNIPIIQDLNNTQRKEEYRTMKETVKKLTAPYEAGMLEHFHWLHEHPELSFEEYETSAYIRKTLAELGIPLQEGIHGTSTVGILEGPNPGPTIAFRADIDALPVQEESGVATAPPSRA